MVNIREQTINFGLINTNCIKITLKYLTFASKKKHYETYFSNYANNSISMKY